MEAWFIYWIASVLITWLFTFSSKISVEKNHNPNLVTFYSAIVAFFSWIIFFIISNWKSIDFKIEIILWAINWIAYLITNLTRIKSLNYIDTSIYFPTYKALWPILIIISSYFYFQEKFTTNQFIWIILWIIVPLLLVTRNSKSKNIKKWIIFLLIWLFSSIFSSFAVKYASIFQVNIVLIVVISLFFQTVWSYALLKRNTKNQIKKDFSHHHIKKIWIITWILNFLGFYSFTNAVNLSWSLWLVYVLQSLYIVIPITLSIIIYKEHFDQKKFIAIVLTILSIYFIK